MEKLWTPKSRHIPRIVIDPHNPDIVYAAVLGNIYKPTSEEEFIKVLMVVKLGPKFFSKAIMLEQLNL